MSFWARVGSLDRRWVFLMVGIAVFTPMLFNLQCKQIPSPIVEGIYDKVEAIPPGARVALSFDYGPSTVPEIQPMANAIIRHCLERDHKLVLLALWATGQNILTATIDSVIQKEYPEKQYGVDYVNFGYKAGNQGVINVVVSDFYKMFPTDVEGGTSREFPMMEGLSSFQDVELIVSFGGGFPGIKEWVQFAGDLANIPVAGGCTAVAAPLLYPYYPQQMVGLMGGIKGAAEYEALISEQYPKFRDTDRFPMRGHEMMGPQTVAHLVIMLFIVIGNIAYFMTRKRQAGERRSMSGELTTWVGALLTLSIFSFLYKDNPFYKFAEHLFVGISAAYWMAVGIWTTLVPNMLCRLWPGMVNTLAGNDCLCPPASQVSGYDRWIYFIPLVLGILLLMRLSPKGGWISRWSLAFIVGITAGLNIVRYLQSDFIVQIDATMFTLLPDWQGFGHFFSNLSLAVDSQLVQTFSTWVVFFGTFCGLVYFFFSKEHKGWFGKASRFGIWVLMVTFGAGFGYTVMARISLLVGRFRFLFGDWIHLVNN